MIAVELLITFVGGLACGLWLRKQRVVITTCAHSCKYYEPRGSSEDCELSQIRKLTEE